MRYARPSKTLRSALIGFTMLLLIAAAACGDDDNGAAPFAGEFAEGTVGIRLSEWSVQPSAVTAAPGEITFQIENAGTTVHNFLVVQTDLAPDALPVEAEVSIVEETQVDVRLGSRTLTPGDTQEETLDLEAGSYLLLCNVPTHYEQGMVVAFTVE